MKLLKILPISFLALSLSSQTIPQTINVPPLHPDPNVLFTVMHFDSPVKNQFSILYYYFVSGSVLSPGEFVQDTGSVVFKDKNWKEPIQNSTSALLIKRQVLDVTGKELSSEEHLLSLRKLDPQSNYKLYFPKNAKEPVVTNRTTLTKSIYNVQQLPNMTDEEQLVLVKFCARYIPVDPNTQAAQVDKSRQNGWTNPTIVDDFKDMKKQFKAIGDARKSMRGDLPRGEKVQTRFSVGELTYVVTKSKGTSEYLKFYLSENDLAFECLDSAKINGDVLVTSVAVAYNMKAQPVGAFTNFHYKYKDEKGEEISRQYSFVMDPEFKIHGWIHSTGKDKLNSLSPEMCWFEGNKFYVLSDNREKIFKTYAQVHEFTLGGEAKLVFPANDEEKGSEKTKYVSTFQPPVPINASQVTPVPERYVPLYALTSGGTKYFIAEGVKYNDAIKANEYLTVKIYRFESTGKLTNIDILGDYRSNRPFPLTPIVKNNQSEYFLLEYPIRVQLAISPEKAGLSQITDDRNFLIETSEGGFVKHAPNGSLMLKKQGIGNKMEILYYAGGN
ncbi:hypothetical protein CNR22_22425 [Sphingobacteriaceae bacterium]|nr:hypothetical protein CNR22_22425 [Sphingobacteriaceae bacterium]